TSLFSFAHNISHHEISPLSLHDALPIFSASASSLVDVYQQALENDTLMRSYEARYEAGKEYSRIARAAMLPEIDLNASYNKTDRSEEHTSELQSRENLVCRLLLEKKKKI